MPLFDCALALLGLERRTEEVAVVDQRPELQLDPFDVDTYEERADAWSSLSAINYRALLEDSRVTRAGRAEPEDGLVRAPTPLVAARFGTDSEGFRS